MGMNPNFRILRHSSLSEKSHLMGWTWYLSNQAQSVIPSCLCKSLLVPCSLSSVSAIPSLHIHQCSDPHNSPFFGLCILSKFSLPPKRSGVSVSSLAVSDNPKPGVVQCPSAVALVYTNYLEATLLLQPKQDSIPGWEEMASGCSMWSLDWILGIISSLKRLSSIGTGYPAKRWSPWPWRYLKDV